LSAAEEEEGEKEEGGVVIDFQLLLQPVCKHLLVLVMLALQLLSVQHRQRCRAREKPS
jgi:hypothetical protein